MTFKILFFRFYDFCVRYRIHLISWSCFIFYDVYITGLINGWFGQIGTYVIIYIDAICIFYMHPPLLKFVARQKRLTIKLITIPMLVIFELLAYILLAFVLRYIFDYLNLIEASAPESITKDFIYANVWRAIYFVGFGTGYYYILKSLENRKKIEKLQRKSLLDQIERHSLENSLIKTQNNYLRSQINPHFLFNTLNFIYNDARKKAPIAAQAIMNLSEMMRYALNRSEALSVVPMEEEINQLEHLVELHKLRTNQSVNLDFNLEGDFAGIKFPPLILVTLVENMFKHGNIRHETIPATITIKHYDHVLDLKFCNLIGPTQKSNRNSNKVGVENTKSRLLSIYKNHCNFNCYVDKVKNMYITEIMVDLSYTPKVL